MNYKSLVPSSNNFSMDKLNSNEYKIEKLTRCETEVYLDFSKSFKTGPSFKGDGFVNSINMYKEKMTGIKSVLSKKFEDFPIIKYSENGLQKGMLQLDTVKIQFVQFTPLILETTEYSDNYLEFYNNKEIKNKISKTDDICDGLYELKAEDFKREFDTPYDFGVYVY